jgi:pilus assembly protein Flp/PilA
MFHTSRALRPLNTTLSTTLTTTLTSALRFLKDESGPTAVEYAVMLALIIVVCITAITTLGTNANNTFSYISTEIQNSGSGS